jgi:hypothetical protein
MNGELVSNLAEATYPIAANFPAAEWITPKINIMILHNYYEISPRNGSHYLLQNGREIAGFDDVATAEQARAGYVAEVAAAYEEADGAMEELRVKGTYYEKTPCTNRSINPNRSQCIEAAWQ